MRLYAGRSKTNFVRHARAISFVRIRKARNNGNVAPQFHEPDVLRGYLLQSAQFARRARPAAVNFSFPLIAPLVGAGRGGAQRIRVPKPKDARENSEIKSAV